MADTTNGIVIPGDISTKKLVALLRTAFNTIVHEAAMMADPLVNISGITNELKPGKEKDTFVNDSVDTAAFLKVSAGADENFARKIVTQMDLPLEAAGQQGRDTPLGNEEDLRALYHEAFANDFAKAVSVQNYGIDARELTPAKLAANPGLMKAQKKLGVWAGELKGMYFRQAMVRRFSANIAVAPVSQTRVMNVNTLIMGVAEASQPAFSATGSTYEDNIRTSLNAVSASDTIHNIPHLLELLPMLENRYIMPLSIGGLKAWILYVHTNIFNDLMNPDYAKSYASYYQSMAAFGAEDLQRKAFPYGSFVLSERLIVVNDPKAPVLGVAAGTFTDYYKTFGRQDDRSGLSEAREFYCSLLFGANAVVMHEPEKMTYREQKDEHDKFTSIALTGAVGFNNVSHKNDDGTTWYNEGSALILSEKKIT